MLIAPFANAIVQCNSAVLLKTTIAVMALIALLTSQPILLDGIARFAALIFASPVNRLISPSLKIFLNLL
jgi:hypothetical protein